MVGQLTSLMGDKSVWLVSCECCRCLASQQRHSVSVIQHPNRSTDSGVLKRHSKKKDTSGPHADSPSSQAHWLSTGVAGSSLRYPEGAGEIERGCRVEFQQPAWFMPHQPSLAPDQ